MKMQDVIAKLREEAPLLDKCAKDVDGTFERACGLADDLCSAKSEAAQELLMDALHGALVDFAAGFRRLRCSIETVVMVNAEYKERLGPRTKKSKDAPGQMTLPGMDLSVSPAEDAARAAIRIAGGRHG